jgi:hypothetical protein
VGDSRKGQRAARLLAGNVGRWDFLKERARRPGAGRILLCAFHLDAAWHLQAVTRVTVDLFEQEIQEALKAYDLYIVCLEKPPESFETTLRRLVEKAIREYETRKAGLRHGIALDRQVTVMVSQTDTDRPMCGIYFNLYSPYWRIMGGKGSGT